MVADSAARKMEFGGESGGSRLASPDAGRNNWFENPNPGVVALPAVPSHGVGKSTTGAVTPVPPL
jgi:hypothetical protein